MIGSSAVYTSKKWIQKCCAVIVIAVLLALLIGLHTGHAVMKQTLGNTITKMKEFAGIDDMVTSPPFMVASTTSEEFVKFPGNKQSPSDKDKDVKGFSVRISPLNNINDVIKKRFRERTALKNKVCASPPYKSMLKPYSLKGRMSHLANGRIHWCKIPKVGTTYLQSLERRFLRSVSRNSAKPPPQIKKMLMVREPYSRLMSGYMGKIVTNPPWQRTFGAKITRRFRPLASEKAKRCGHDVTFSEFLKYIIESQTTGWLWNLHFVPISKQCNPCTDKYDFIGHLETIKDDLAFALKSVNVSVDMDFSDEEMTSKGKAASIINHREKIVKCESMCSALSKVWWTFQARGLIASDVPFQMTEKQCDIINGTSFADMVWDAHIQSKSRVNKSKQRRDALVTLYLQVPLEDRLKIQELLRKDCELYGYDAQPDDLFPELKTTTS